jgi:hypothetical protein
MGVRKLTGIIAETMPAINPNDKVQFSAGGAEDGRKIDRKLRHPPIHAPLWRTVAVHFQMIAPNRRKPPQKRESLRAAFKHGDVTL